MRSDRAKEIDESLRWFRLGDQAFNLGNYSQAGKWYQKVLDAYPNGPLVNEARGAVRACEDRRK